MTLGLGAVALSLASQAQITTSTPIDFTVTDIHGETHNMQSTLDGGQYMLIDFYAYWCGPCMDLADDLTEVYNDFGCNSGDVKVISIEYEGTNSQVEAFEAAHAGDNPGPAVSGQEGGGGTVHAQWGVQAFPTFVLIDPDGNIVESDIWPASYTILKSTLEGYGVQLKSCEAATGISDIKVISNIVVSPNPATEMVNVQFQLSESTRLQAELFNLVGSKVMDLGLQQWNPGTQNMQIELGDLSTGQYFLKLSNAEGGVKTVRFSVQ